MDRIRQLYQVFSKTEVRYLKQYLDAFHAKGANKSLELIEILDKNPEITNKEMAERLYGNPKSKAFSMLKSRLYERMLETLTLSVNFQNNPALKEDSTAYESVSLSKMNTYGIMLNKRGLKNQSREMFEKIIKDADQTVLPEFNLSALISLRNLSNSFEEVEKNINPKIALAFEQYKIDAMGVGMMRTFILHRGETNHPVSESLARLKKDIKILEDSLAKTYSPRADYYRLQLYYSFYAFSKDMPSVRSVLQEIIELVERYPKLSTNNRKGILLMRLSNIALNQGNYEEAIEASQKSMRMLYPKSPNYFSATILSIMAYTVTGRLSKVEELFPKIEWFIKFPQSPQQTGQFHFFKASKAYLEKDLKGAQRYLQHTNDLLKDKEGWNLAVRVMEMMILIDLGEDDLLYNRLESFRKHMSKYNIPPRIQTTYRLLLSISRNALNFKVVWEECEEVVDEMRQTHPWSIHTYEFLPFDIWLESKAKNMPFYPTLLQMVSASKTE
ncbi:MAG: hypothetical protein AAFO96_20325 [Bacteroidota bacterium]